MPSTNPTKLSKIKFPYDLNRLSDVSSKSWGVTSYGSLLAVSTAIFDFLDVSLRARLRIASQSVTKGARIIQISGYSAMAFAKIYSFTCKFLCSYGLWRSGFGIFGSSAMRSLAWQRNETHFFGNRTLEASQKASEKNDTPDRMVSQQVFHMDVPPDGMCLLSGCDPKWV